MEQRAVDLTMQECYTFDAEVGQPLEQRAVDLAMQECYTFKSDTMEAT